MSSLKKFISAVTANAVISGKVVASAGTTMSVATRSGVVVVPRGGASLYAVGDEVKVANGTIVGKVRDISSLPVYEV